GARGVSPSVTVFGPPDRTIPFGTNARTNASSTSYGWISQYTCGSRRRRAINCVYCAPKSRIRIRECEGAAIGCGDGDPTGLLDAIIRGFLHDLHVVHVRLAHAGRRDLDELGARAHIVDRLAAAVAHRRPQAAHQLVDELGQRPLVRDAALDPLGD